jgi:hypothetical protein
MKVTKSLYNDRSLTFRRFDDDDTADAAAAAGGGGAVLALEGGAETFPGVAKCHL